MGKFRQRPSLTVGLPTLQTPNGSGRSLTKEENSVMFKRIALVFCLMATLAMAAAAQQPQASTRATMSGSMSPQEKRSLYNRLGGYDAIAAVVDDFITRLATDPRFGKFFSGFSTDSKKRLRQHILDQFCVAAGGPCVYMGRDMKTTHTGLGITEADWDAAAKHLVAALDKYKVPLAEKDELMAFVGTQKKDIVEK
jgi:hemoglobin